MAGVIMCAGLALFGVFIWGEFEESHLLILDIILTPQVCLCLASLYFTLPVFSYNSQAYCLFHPFVLLEEDSLFITCLVRFTNFRTNLHDF